MQTKNLQTKDRDGLCVSLLDPSDCKYSPYTVLPRCFGARFIYHASTTRAHVQPQAAAASDWALWLVPFAMLRIAPHAPNPAGRCRHAPSRAVLSAVAETCTLTNHRPTRTLLQVDCKALWRCGLCAAEALSGSVRLRDASSSEGLEQPCSGSGMFDGRGLHAIAR